MNLIFNIQSGSEISSCSPYHNNSNGNVLPKPSYLEERKAYYKCQKPRMSGNQSFSPDGRVLCVPEGRHTRLLAFDENCQEPVMCQDQGQEPKEMTELCVTEGHEYLVLATKFSPRGHLLATGCIDGQVKFHQPVL